MVDQYTLGLARRNGAAADSWMEYARKLERKLATANAGLSAMRALKNIAITELAKVDPQNSLLIGTNQQKILDEEYKRA
jgi:hypothetical protein